MGNPLETKTITLSCGKLTTGVTIRPWTGVFMLRNLKSPETYFQTAFRVQSPWEVVDDNGILVTPGNQEEIWRAIKKYIDHPETISQEGKASLKNIRTYLPAHVMTHLRKIYLEMAEVRE
jgi:hypothetical protein